jgi:hypothetical protein
MWKGQLLVLVQLRNFLEELKAITNTTKFCTRSSSHPSSSQELSKAMETTRKVRQIEVTENNVLYCSPVAWCSTIVHKFISCSLPWYFRKSRVDNVFWSFFNQALPEFKVRSVSPGFTVEAEWLKCAAPQTLSYSVVQPISNLSHDPRTIAMGGFSLYEACPGNKDASRVGR